MITHIGIVAGEIWTLLEEYGDMELKQLLAKIEEQKLNIEKEVVLMTLGWLAREGHLIVRREGDDYTICLKE